MRKNWLLWIGVVGIVGCGGGVQSTDQVGTDSGSGPVDAAVLSVLSPADGSVLAEGEDVLLSVEAVGSVSGDILSIASVDWRLNVSEWGASGNDVSVSDLPAGNLQLIATAMVGEREVTAAVDLIVEPRRFELSGSMDAEIEVYSSEWGMTFDDDCKGPMAFVLEGNVLSGTGACVAFDETVDFLVTGTDNNGEVTGEMGVSDGEENVPFNGTWNSDTTTLMGSFDQTWESGDGTLRLFGSFSATAD